MRHDALSPQDYGLGPDDIAPRPEIGPVACLTCWGSGYVVGPPETIETPDGPCTRDVFTCPDCDRCPDCHGYPDVDPFGYPDGEPCATCGSWGRVPRAVAVAAD